VAGTWSGKYITRNTEGWLHFDNTPFPPGPHGSGPSTVTWGNMLVISRRSQQPDLAWEYIKFITSKEGSLRLLRHIEQNSPRKDFYETPAWREMCARNPYLWNVPGICASGKKLRHTQINATDHATRPIFESILLRYPEIVSGRGPYPSVEAGLKLAAGAADRVYQRYNDQVAYWRAKQMVGR
jgi:ABC-type glycerol-3-phosphate transport system substrate-binding protein